MKSGNESCEAGELSKLAAVFRQPIKEKDRLSPVHKIRQKKRKALTGFSLFLPILHIVRK